MARTCARLTRSPRDFTSAPAFLKSTVTAPSSTRTTLSSARSSVRRSRYLLLPTAFLLLAELAAGVAPTPRARGTPRRRRRPRRPRRASPRWRWWRRNDARARTVMRRGRRERVRPAILVVVKLVDVEARWAAIVPLALSVGAGGARSRRGAPAKERARALRRTGRIRRRGRAMARPRRATRRGRAKADARGDDILSHSAGEGRSARGARDRRVSERAPDGGCARTLPVSGAGAAIVDHEGRGVGSPGVSRTPAAGPVIASPAIAPTAGTHLRITRARTSRQSGFFFGSNDSTIDGRFRRCGKTRTLTRALASVFKVPVTTPRATSHGWRRPSSR